MGKSSKSRRCLMSSAIPLMTCLTIIESRIENSKYLYKCISDLKACLDYFCERPKSGCENLNFLLPKQNHSTDWEASIACLNFFERLHNFSQQSFRQMG